MRCKKDVQVEVKADFKRDAEFGRGGGWPDFAPVASLGGIVKNSLGAGDGSTGLSQRWRR
jgi:hypothetical protein